MTFTSKLCIAQSCKHMTFIDFYWWHYCEGPTTFTTPLTRWYCWYPPPGAGRFWKPWKYEKRYHSNPSPSEYRWFGGKMIIPKQNTRK